VIVYTGQGGGVTDPNKADRSPTRSCALGNAGLMKSRVEGLPVRVVRGAHPGSPFAPETGFRYDGLYYVEDAYHVIGKSDSRSGVSRYGVKTRLHRPGHQ
jgi:putative restriction endonuclease